MLLFGDCNSSMDIGDTTEIKIDTEARKVELSDKAYEDCKEEGRWSVVITQDGITYNPWWVRVYYSSEVLRFIGERVTPLLLQSSTTTDYSKLPLITQAKFDLILAVGEIHDSTLLSISPYEDCFPEIIVPFDCEVTRNYTLLSGGVLELESTSKHLVLRITGVTLSNECNIGTFLPKGTKLGIVTDNLELTLMYLQDGCTYKNISPLILFGRQAETLLDNYRSSDYNSVKELYNETMQLYLKEEGNTPCKVQTDTTEKDIEEVPKQ